MFLVLIALSLALALFSRRGHRHQRAEDFFVASGQFGSTLFFFLAVGETYSVLTILGFPGGVYAHGTGFIAWFLGYILLAFPVGYFLNPWIWRAGRRYGAVTLPDLFRRHFDSRTLELVVTLSSILFLVPYGTMQFIGLDTVLHGLGWPLPPLLLTGLAGCLAFAYIATSGPARAGLRRGAQGPAADAGDPADRDRRPDRDRKPADGSPPGGGRPSGDARLVARRPVRHVDHPAAERRLLPGAADLRDRLLGPLRRHHPACADRHAALHGDVPVPGGDRLFRAPPPRVGRLAKRRVPGGRPPAPARLGGRACAGRCGPVGAGGAGRHVPRTRAAGRAQTWRRGSMATSSSCGPRR